MIAHIENKITTPSLIVIKFYDKDKALKASGARPNGPHACMMTTQEQLKPVLGH